MFSIDTAAAISELQRSGVENRQAAAIVGIVAKADTDHATKSDVDGVRTELKAVKTELKADIDGVRTELKADIDGVRAELNAMKTAFNAEIDVVKADIELVRSQVQEGFAALGSELSQTAVRFAELQTEQQRHANRFLIALISVAAAAVAATLGGLAIIL